MVGCMRKSREYTGRMYYHNLKYIQQQEIDVMDWHINVTSLTSTIIHLLVVVIVDTVFLNIVVLFFLLILFVLLRNPTFVLTCATPSLPSHPRNTSPKVL